MVYNPLGSQSASSSDLYYIGSEFKFSCVFAWLGNSLVAQRQGTWNAEKPHAALGDYQHSPLIFILDRWLTLLRSCSFSRFISSGYGQARVASVWLGWSGPSTASKAKSQKCIGFATFLRDLSRPCCALRWTRLSTWWLCRHHHQLTLTPWQNCNIHRNFRKLNIPTKLTQCHI